ncbi:hypothetical protein L218DRAFT_946090 [Marasmius fiardii PR-910]|nr:hypothetical protein L218DRAFT_946090 [Marasmius fiardii PR-910]
MAGGSRSTNDEASGFEDRDRIENFGSLGWCICGVSIPRGPDFMVTEKPPSEIDKNVGFSESNHHFGMYVVLYSVKVVISDGVTGLFESSRSLPATRVSGDQTSISETSITGSRNTMTTTTNRNSHSITTTKSRPTTNSHDVTYNNHVIHNHYPAPVYVMVPALLAATVPLLLSYYVKRR